MILNVFLSIIWFMPFSFILNIIYQRAFNRYLYYISQFLLIVVSFYLLLYPGKFADYFFWSPFSLILVLCTLILSLICYLLIEARIQIQTQLLHFCILMIQAVSITFFSTQNLFTFYILFELVLIPFFLIIICWGSKGKNIKAALYFFFYTYIASLPMLFSTLYIYLQNYAIIIFYMSNVFSDNYISKVIWWSFFVAFAAKLAIPPLHLWLVEAHVEAPTVGSVLLSGIALKIGLFGYISILPVLFNTIHYKMQYTAYPFLLTAFVYIVFIFMAQMDLKKIIAYLSIIHMVFILLGLFSNTLEGYQGGILMAITHSFISPALFCCVGFIYDRYENRSLINFSGLTKYMPVLSTIIFLLFLVEIGFPLTINFIGELLMLKGIFDFIHYFIFILCVPYVLLAATIFKTFNKMFFGPVSYDIQQFSDVTFKELIILLILCLPLIIMFIVPQFLVDFGGYIFYINQLFFINP